MIAHEYDVIVAVIIMIMMRDHHDQKQGVIFCCFTCVYPVQIAEIL